MKSSGKRFSAVRGTFAYSNVIVVSVTGNFKGGLVLVNSIIQEANPTAGNWVQNMTTIDGVAIGTPRIIWQPTGIPNIAVPLTSTYRVPQGVHRIGLIMQSSAAAGFGVNGAAIDVIEL